MSEHLHPDEPEPIPGDEDFEDYDATEGTVVPFPGRPASAPPSSRSGERCHTNGLRLALHSPLYDKGRL